MSENWDTYDPAFQIAEQELKDPVSEIPQPLLQPLKNLALDLCCARVDPAISQQPLPGESRARPLASKVALFVLRHGQAVSPSLRSALQELPGVPSALSRFSESSWAEHNTPSTGGKEGKG